MDKLVLFIKECNKSVTIEYNSELPDEDGSRVGWCPIKPKEMEDFIQASQEGKLYTFQPGHKYQVTGLTAEGKFKLVPDLKP
jgi:hypothetical protein